MTKKISRRQLRQELMYEYKLIKEVQELNEFFAAIARAIPAVAKYAPTVMKYGKNLLGMGKSAAKTVGGKAAGLGKKTAIGGAKAYGAYSLGDMIFGGDTQKAEEVQAAMASAPGMAQMSPEGVQAVFGQNDPQQMHRVAQNVNQNSLHDAMTLYGALKGLGTDEAVVQQVIQSRKGSLAQLYKEYARFVTTNTDDSNEPSEKCLIKWLEDDGEDQVADLVRLELQA